MTPAAKLEELLSPGQISEHDGKPILSPQTTEEIASIARYANQHNLAIEITGAGTKRSWGNPVTAGILLDTTHVTGVVSHSWQDLTATVAAGTTWSAMQRVLAQHNQQVALDPLWPETATVGGIIATNDSGALRLKYGSLRDLIIGMTIVLADGTIAKSGGKVVKNVAGYDLHKLMTGAFGTLGIITEVTFRLHPVPQHTRTWTISSPSVDDTAKLMLKVLDSHLSVQAMQFRASAEGYALDVELASLPEVLAEQIKTLEQFARNAGITGASRSPSAPSIFAAREELFSHPARVVIKATMLPDGIANICADVVRLVGSAVTQSSGIMFARFTGEAAAAALPSLYAYVDAAGGEITILRGPKYPLPEWAIPPWGPDKAPPLMREIKHRFDPNRILNPGRFLGGI
ncbi:MAG TPA: FAD-binding oxidoreductase [Acidobacteriaceae bacterium]